MNKNPISIPIKKIGNFFYQYNLVIFIVLVTGGLIASILILNNIINQPETSIGISTVTNPTTFDQATAIRLQKLENSTNNNSYQTLPSGRINPFTE